MNNSFIHFNNYPPIYKISLDNQQELLTIYGDILKDVPVEEVGDKFASYVSSSIEPTDWRGIWRTGIKVSTSGHSTTLSTTGLLDKTSDARSSSVLSNQSDAGRTSTKTRTIKCDFEVEVVDVSQRDLTAVIVVRNLLSPTLDTLTTASFDAINEFLTTQKVRTIKLSEMYVISEGDDDEHLLNTAMVIEQVRFFYKYIWRPWDDVVTNDNAAKDIFITNQNRLENRLNLYFEMKNKFISESICNKIHKLLDSGHKIRSLLDDIVNKNSAPNEVDMNSQCSSMDDDCINGGSADLMDEVDVYEMMKLKVKLEDIEREMKLLEDPYLRCVATSINRVQYDSNNEDEEDEVDEDIEQLNGTISDAVDSTMTTKKRSEENKIHVLCKRITSKELELVNERIKNSSEDVEVLFYKKLNRIISSGQLKDGDKILILPGVHTIDALPWIDKDVIIEGVIPSKGSSNDVTLLGTKLIGDIFINCSSSAVTISNISIKTSTETHAIVVVHSGSTDLINCTINGSMSKQTVVSLSKADVVLDNCNIITSDLLNKGLLCKQGSNMTVDGKRVDVQEDEEGCSKVSKTSKSSLKNVQFFSDEKILNTAN